MSLEARIKRLEDVDAIRQLCSRYSLAVDDHDFDALESVFSRDATYGWSGREPDATGQAAVVELLRSRLSSAGPSFHVNHDHIIDWEADGSARGVVFAHAEGSPGGKQYINAIRYHDRYVEEDGGWRIAERSLAFLYIVSPDDYANIMLQKDRLRHVSPALPGHWPHFAR